MKGKKLKIKKLAPEVVSRLKILKDECNEKKERIEEMVPQIKKLMKISDEVETTRKKNSEGGTVTTRIYNPGIGHHGFQHCEYKVVDVDWREQVEKLYQQIHGKKKWQKQYRLFLAKLPRKKQETLTVVEMNTGE